MVRKSAAVIELRARFDEESNIEVANLLQEAGAVVVYGIVGYKTHAKMILIVRREVDKIKRYVHLGTGNYHAMNAKIYTDYGLLTSDADICEDVHKVFQELTGMGKMVKLKKLFHAPFTLHSQLIELIENETENSKAGKKAQIIIKVNALTESQLIDALYRASQAGVQIDLIIRSICCLRPQVKGLSENIRVRSIVGRFLNIPGFIIFTIRVKVNFFAPVQIGWGVIYSLASRPVSQSKIKNFVNKFWKRA